MVGLFVGYFVGNIIEVAVGSVVGSNVRDKVTNISYCFNNHQSLTDWTCVSYTIIKSYSQYNKNLAIVVIISSAHLFAQTNYNQSVTKRAMLCEVLVLAFRFQL